jgi:hypothetical protein
MNALDEVLNSIILTKRCGIKFSDSPHSEHVNLQDWRRRNPRRPDGTYKVEGKGEVAKFIGGALLSFVICRAGECTKPSR